MVRLLLTLTTGRFAYRDAPWNEKVYSHYECGVLAGGSEEFL